MEQSEYWIQHLGLKPHPEGGYFKETYRSNIKIGTKDLPVGFSDNRDISTSILYLLPSNQVSKLHRLKSDELWYFHHGSSIKLHLIDREGKKHSKLLGPRLEKAEQFQVLVPAGIIFAAEVMARDSYSLCGCVVSPGFEYQDYELFDREDLIQAYPKHQEFIEKFS